MIAARSSVRRDIGNCLCEVVVSCKPVFERGKQRREIVPRYTPLTYITGYKLIPNTAFARIIFQTSADLARQRRALFIGVEDGNVSAIACISDSPIRRLLTVKHLTGFEHGYKSPVERL